MNNNDYVSDYFYHFVGRRNALDHESNFNTLIKILKPSQFRHSPFTEDGSENRSTFDRTRSPFSEELINPSVICFCDIPYESLNIHCAKYGYFGISISREKLITLGAQPVMYIPYKTSATIGGNNMLKDVWSTYAGYHDHLCDLNGMSVASFESGTGKAPANTSEALNFVGSYLRDTVAYIKPFNAELAPDHPHNYYMEREWRKFGYMDFVGKDIGKIIVFNGYKEKLIKEFPHYAQFVVEVSG